MKNKEIQIGDSVRSWVVQDRNGKPVDVKADLKVVHRAGDNITVEGGEYEGNKRWKLKVGDVRSF